MNWTLFLQVLALVCLVLAALNVSTKFVNLGWAGLAVWLLSSPAFMALFK